MAATVKPIDVIWKLVPAGKGMVIIQSDPLPESDAKLRMADLDKEENPGEPEESDAGDMGELAPAAEKPTGMPAFGKKAAPAGGMDMAAMLGGGGARPNPFAKKPAMPPFSGGM